jgi:taurine dioxygenase
MELPRLYADPAAKAEAPAWLPWTEHRAVMAHPVTGAPLLFVNEMQTARLVGVNEEESWALMQAVFGYLYDPPYVYEHMWNQGDLVIWDNIALQHARSALPARSRRTLQRVIVADKRFSELYPDVPAEELG